MAVGLPIFRQEIQVRPDRLERLCYGECGTVEDASTDTITRSGESALAKRGGGCRKSLRDRCIPPDPGSGQPGCPHRCAVAGRRPPGCESRAEMRERLRAPGPRPAAARLNCGPADGSAQSAPHGCRPGRGRRLDGRNPAVRTSHTTQVRMSGGGARPRSCGCSNCCLRTSVPITSRSSGVSTSSTGVRRAHGAPAKTPARL